MSMIMIDDDDDNVVDIQEDKDVSHLKGVIKQGLSDLKEISSLLEQIIPLIEPFGDADVIEELMILYGEVIPNTIVGDFSAITEGLYDEELEITKLALSQRRKTIINGLLEKYSK